MAGPLGPTPLLAKDSIPILTTFCLHDPWDSMGPLPGALLAGGRSRMTSSRNFQTLVAIRARRVWRSVTDWIIARDVDEGWLLLLFAAAIGVAAGGAVILFYELIDGVRGIAGWAARRTGDKNLPWLALATLPVGLLLAVHVRMGVRDLDYIPVVESDESRRLLGLLSRAEILEAYQTRLMLQD